MTDKQTLTEIRAAYQTHLEAAREALSVFDEQYLIGVLERLFKLAAEDEPPKALEVNAPTLACIVIGAIIGLSTECVRREVQKERDNEQETSGTGRRF